MDKHENIFVFGGTREIIGGVGRSPYTIGTKSGYAPSQTKNSLIQTKSITQENCDLTQTSELIYPFSLYFQHATPQQNSFEIPKTLTEPNHLNRASKVSTTTTKRNQKRKSKALPSP